MKNFNTVLIVIISSFFLVFPESIHVFAATTPSLGAASTYGIISTTFTNSLNTGTQTIINGDVCNTTAPVTPPVTTSGITTTGGCSAATGSGQSTALTNLNTQSCTSLGTNVVLSGTYTPGCYSSSGTMDIVLSTTVTLNGTGTYIFRAGGTFTTGQDSRIVLTNGASAADVFWAPIGATTIGANTAPSLVTPTFVGNILDAAGITIGHFVHLLGRALAFGGTVTTDSNTITVPSASTLATLHVIKQIINTGGGTAILSDFTLSVKNSTGMVMGSATGTGTPGTSYTLSGGTYTVSENTNTSYTQSFSGACSSTGSVTLLVGDDKTCTITSNYIIPPIIVSSGGGGSLRMDDCPDGDYSYSYYDSICGTIPVIKSISSGSVSIVTIPMLVTITSGSTIITKIIIPTKEPITLVNTGSAIIPPLIVTIMSGSSDINIAPIANVFVPHLPDTGFSLLNENYIWKITFGISILIIITLLGIIIQRKSHT